MKISFNIRIHINGVSAMNGNNDKEYPLVSILIPTYNRPHYFELALESALQQTYQNIEILIGDDSTNNETSNLVQNKYLQKNPNITYIKNPYPLGQFHNSLMLFEKAKGIYINFLMDDDLFYPEKIQKMIAYFLTDYNEEIALVTSFRKLINRKGKKLRDSSINKKISETNGVFSGIEIGNQILMNCFNYIGEPTTPLFRKQNLTEPFGSLNNRKYNCSVDLASWILLLSKGNLAYISEPLSCFRIHPDQQLQSYTKLVEGIEDLTHLVLTSKQYGFLKRKEEQQQALHVILLWIKKGINYYENKEEVNIRNRLLHCLQVIQRELNCF